MPADIVESVVSKKRFCHLCKEQKDETIMCCNRIGNASCNRAFCRDCILKYFKEDMDQLINSDDLWICYCCMARCRCKSCKNVIQKRLNTAIPSISLCEQKMFCLPVFHRPANLLKRPVATDNMLSSLPQKKRRETSEQNQTIQEDTSLQSDNWNPRLSKPLTPQELVERQNRVIRLLQPQSDETTPIQQSDTLIPSEAIARLKSFKSSSIWDRIQKIPKRPCCDLSVYSNRFLFHSAIYTSITPSEGVTVNCLSTYKDVESLKSQKVIPTYTYTRL